MREGKDLHQPSGDDAPGVDVDPAESWDAFESALESSSSEDAWSALERAIAKLTTKEAWTHLEKVLRRAIRLVTTSAGTHLGAREKADLEHELWKRLGLLYSDRLDASESAVTALEMAVTLRADDDQAQLALGALHEQSEQIERALRCNEIAVRVRPRRIEGYRNLFRLHARRGDHDAAWCAASALAFLGQPGPEADFFTRHASPTAAPPANLDETSWRLLRHEDESDVITGVFQALAQAAARLANAENRAGSGADRWFGSAGGSGPAELAFMAGRRAAYGRAPLRSLLGDHAALSDLEDLFMAALRSVWLDAWRPSPVFGERAVERAAHLTRLLAPAELVALRTAVVAVRRQGQIDVVKWARGVALTAARAGLLFSGDLVTAERALRRLADTPALSVDDTMHELLAFAASGSYVALRRTLGRGIDVEAAERSHHPAARRERALVDLAAALRTAEGIAGVARALSSLPSSCGLVHDPATVTARAAYLDLAPPIGANDLARIFGWHNAVGENLDQFMREWVVRVVTANGQFGPETAFPTIGNWGVTAILGGRPTGGSWKWIPPGPSTSGPPPRGGVVLFGPTDVVHRIQFGA